MWDSKIEEVGFSCRKKVCLKVVWGVRVNVRELWILIVRDLVGAVGVVMREIEREGS